MSEKERCKRFMLLIQKLYKENDIENLELLETFSINDTSSIKKAFEIMTKSSPLSEFFGQKNLCEMETKNYKQFKLKKYNDGYIVIELRQGFQLFGTLHYNEEEDIIYAVDSNNPWEEKLSLYYLVACTSNLKFNVPILNNDNNEIFKDYTSIYLKVENNKVIVRNNHVDYKFKLDEQIK